MPVTPTYPGIYIEELPSSTHTITAAATNIAVFIGHTHPFKTRPSNWGQAIELFSFSDYERELGGYYSSETLDNDVPNSVNQFFINGGSHAYVVPLQPHFWDPVTKQDKGVIAAATLNVGGLTNVTFTALQPVDASHPMVVTVSNLQPSNSLAPTTLDVADITISYGTVSETFRRVTINAAPVNPADLGNFIEKRLGTVAKPVSSLVTVFPNGGAYGTVFVALNQVNLSVNPAPNANWTTFSPSEFAPVFQQDNPLDKVPIFNMLLVPGVADNTIWSEALAFCERKQAFAILDPPDQAAADLSSFPLPLIADLMDQIVPKSTNGAIYFPYLKSADPLTGNNVELAPGGYIAGIYARTDVNRGVWKAPAGYEATLLNTTGVVKRGQMTDPRQGTLNPKGINCIRDFPGIGTVVFGARTLVAENPSFEQWRYVPVRRTALFIEQTLYRNLGWAIFEPNDNPLWVALRITVENFMLSLFNQGAFQGATPSQAFQVKCDSTTTTQTDIDNGIVNIIVAFAPLKPAEFVIVKIAQLAGQSQS